MPHNKSLDGLRAIAVLMVVVFHCRIPEITGGFIGVSIFFVLSGYLITTLLRQELDRTGTIYLRRFYWRRVIRLVPALLMMLAAYAAVSPMMFSADIWAVLTDVALAGLYVSDYAMAFWQAPKYLSHTWSLSVEEHFYLLWPISILLTRRLNGARLSAWLLAAFLLATVWRVADLLIWTDWYRTYYRFDTRISGLLLGGAIAVLPWRPEKDTAAWLSSISMLVLAICWAVLRIKTNSSLLWGDLVVDLASAGLILSLASGADPMVKRALSWTPIVYVGVISYSIYLWHYPIARMLRESMDPKLQLMIVAPLSFAIASLSYRYVEKPLLDWGRERFTPSPDPKSPLTTSPAL